MHANNSRCDAISMHDIGTCYAQDTPNENVTKLNFVMYVYFMDNPAYLYDIEKNIMRKFDNRIR